MKRVAILIDGYFMRKRIGSLQQNTPADSRVPMLRGTYQADRIRDYCLQHVQTEQNEELYRILYYDSDPCLTTGINPVSKTQINFALTPIAKKQTELFKKIRKCPNFALRLGHSQWQGSAWQISHAAQRALLDNNLQVSGLKDSDFKPAIQQKGVDMRIGLDIASMAYKRLVHKIVVITGDQDFVPALKLARREGIIVGLDPLLQNIDDYLAEHVDYIKSFIPSLDRKSGGMVRRGSQGRGKK